jgi:hypothetical protein
MGEEMLLNSLLLRAVRGAGGVKGAGGVCSGRDPENGKDDGWGKLVEKSSLRKTHWGKLVGESWLGELAEESRGEEGGGWHAFKVCCPKKWWSRTFWVDAVMARGTLVKKLMQRYDGRRRAAWWCLERSNGGG